MNVGYLSFSQVVEIHADAMKAEGQDASLVRPEDLEAAIARPMAAAFSADLYPDLSSKAAALMHSIVTRHPFLDGNKRAGLTAAIIFLQVNGVTARADQEALYELTMGVASGEIRDVEPIAERLAELFGLDADA